ncbi:MAG: hypothetical protein IJ773_05340 [Lachnospiraceae bacterium]|nr:hypothetical protein [Lachnospiraceae bacterium]
MKEYQSYDLRTAAAALSLITMIYYFIQSHTDSCYQPVIVVLLLLAALCENLSLFNRADFLPMAAAMCLGVCFGLMLYYVLPSFSDLWNQVNFIGGNTTAYFIYLGAILVSFLFAEAGAA